MNSKKEEVTITFNNDRGDWEDSIDKKFSLNKRLKKQPLFVLFPFPARRKYPLF